MDYSQAQIHACRQLEFDNLNENAYRQLMLALFHDGQRNAAISQFKLCKQRLERDLGFPPSSETMALFEQIQSETIQDLRTAKPDSKTTRTNKMPVFLLTDIEGSTRLWDQYHQAMLPALFKHNQIVPAEPECKVLPGGEDEQEGPRGTPDPSTALLCEGQGNIGKLLQQG